MTTRQVAKILGYPDYHGKPCKTCGRTLKWVGNRSCVKCAYSRTRAINGERYATDPEYREQVSRRSRTPEVRERGNRRRRERYSSDSEYRATAKARSQATYKRRVTDPEWRAAESERKRADRQKRIDAGLCANCGQPKLSEQYCWSCLNKKQFALDTSKAANLGVSTEVPDDCR